jgi:sialic acid synthase SpsE
MSLEPPDMHLFIRKIRELEIALGNSRRILHPAELEKRKAIRRSAFLKVPVSKGQTVDGAQIEFKRPGYGIPPNEFERLQFSVFAKDLPAGHMIRFEDLTGAPCDS